MSSLTDGLNFDKPTGKGGKPAKSGGPSSSAVPGSDGLKIGIVVVCFLVASVMLLNQFSVINLFGDGAPVVKPQTAQEQAEYQKQVQAFNAQRQKEQAEWDKLPPSQRPVIVGGD
ncbi:MAG: hypothetical protein K2X32_09505 [Phycisphaerales bacterium]|nr:hypothetical protein [Phycisphaerales bacterium]